MMKALEYAVKNRNTNMFFTNQSIALLGEVEIDSIPLGNKNQAARLSLGLAEQMMALLKDDTYEIEEMRDVIEQTSDDILDSGILDCHLQPLLEGYPDIFRALHASAAKMEVGKVDDRSLFNLSMSVFKDYMSEGGFISDEISLLAREIFLDMKNLPSDDIYNDESAAILDRLIGKQFLLGAKILIHEANDRQ